MSALLIKLFVKDYKNTGDAKVRNSYGVLSGIVGIILNILFSAFKIIFGRITASISITADGYNNLFDAGSSIINLAGFKISGKPADKDHPFGHGRTEYVSALVLAFLVLFMSVELIKSSVSSFRSGEAVIFSTNAIIVLVCSILGKIWLAYFNTKVGKAINSIAVDAVVKDSIGDIAATSATLIALIASKYTSLPIDAAMGIVVALFILYSGISIIRDTMGPLLGEPPSPEIVDELEKIVLSHEGVLGIHDMVLHSYGTGRYFCSLHAEVPADVDILISHEIIDDIELDVKNELGIELSIHLDPIDTNDERIQFFRNEVNEILAGLEHKYTAHDLRIVEGKTHTNLIFDVVKPYECKMTEEELIMYINEKVKERNPQYRCVIKIDNQYV